VRLIRPTARLFFISCLAAAQSGHSATTHSATAPRAGGASSRANPPGADAPVQRRGLPAFTTPPEDSVGSHEFYFTRSVYSGYRRGGSWRVDFPRADRIFLTGLRRMTLIDAYEGENPVSLADPNLTRFPFLYVLEVGGMGLTPAEAEGLRNYLLAGGFLFVDDFWGTYEWMNFEREITRVLPGYPMREIPLDHPVFSTVYDIDSIIQVPNVGNGRRGGPTYERDGYVPHVRGIFDENDRLMVAIHWNTDLGDAWEWADDPYYPLRYSNYAWQVAINFIVYAMTH
jgi:hypothetical protein